MASFDDGIAKRYGIEAAVLIEALFKEMRESEGKRDNYHQGHYWAVETVSSLHQQYPYISESKVRRTLELLEKEELIKSGCFNADRRDRAKWYTFTKKGNTLMRSTDIMLRLGDAQEDLLSTIADGLDWDSELLL